MAVIKNDQDLCPHCKVQMEERTAKNQPAHAGTMQPAALVRQFECPRCHHLEGRRHQS